MMKSATTPRGKTGRTTASGDGATRRDVLAGLAGATALAALPAATASASASAIPDTFLAASSKLCGITLDKSYIQLANTIWQALTARGDRDLLRICRIAATAPDDATLERKLVNGPLLWPQTEALISAWYTGMVPVGAPAAAGSRVITYDDALAWTVCQDFTKPPATCGGPFGYWHDEPPV